MIYLRKTSTVLLRIDKVLSLGMDTVACRRGVGCLRLIPTISVHLVTDALTLQTHWVIPRLVQLRVRTHYLQGEFEP